MGKSVVRRDGEQKKTLVFGGREKDQFCVTLCTDCLNIISNIIWKLS